MNFKVEGKSVRPKLSRQNYQHKIIKTKLSTQELSRQNYQDRIIKTELSRQNYQDRIIKTKNIFFDLFGLVTFLLIKLFE